MKLKDLSLQQASLAFLVLLLVFSAVFKELSWGFNHLWFLPAPLIVLTLGLAAALFWIFSKRSLPQLKFLPALIALPVLVLLLVAIAPLATEAYGDTRSILSNYEAFFHGKRSVEDAVLALIDPNIFKLHNGEKFTFNAIFLLMKSLNLTLKEAFYVFDLMWAVLAAAAFICYLKLAGIVNYFVPLLLFLSVNFMLIFSGHIEVYAPSIFFLFLFLLSLKLHLQKLKLNTLIYTVLSAVLLIKVHLGNVIVLGPLAFVAALFFFPKMVKYITTRNGLVFWISGVVGFFLAYFFVLHSANSNYAQREAGFIENVFLPLFSSEAPYNHYGLLHPNHLVDFISLLLLWSPVLWYLLIKSWWQKEMKQQTIMDVVLIFLLLSYLFESFALNPLLSMPRDWDLLSLGAPVLLIYAAQLWSRSKEIEVKQLNATILAGFVLFSLPRYVVESQPNLSANRLTVVGDHVYKTYYAGSSVLLSMAVKQTEKPDYEALKANAAYLDQQAKGYPDNELSHYFSQTAYWLADDKGKSLLALDFFRLALDHNNEYEIALKGAAIVLQNNNRLDESLPLVYKLLEINPKEKGYYHMLFNCLVALKKEKELKEAAYSYLKLFPEDRNLIRSKLGVE
ncbi:hypothetical protein GC194_06120 [bacterium]|nr:hypothetical protein [bacterium]